jgi:cobalt-zinc-cadmium efflux system outer membrane protein
MYFPNRRPQLTSRRILLQIRKDSSSALCGLLASALFSALFVATAMGQTTTGPKITLDQAIELAIEHNHGLLAARTNIPQNQALEVQANVRPNPTLFTDWEYLPLVPAPGGVLDYLHNSTEGDIGISYMFERGQKRQHRLQAAQDTTNVSRSTVRDNERTLVFQVAQLYITAQLAESTLELARQDLKSFETTLDISAHQYKTGAISENDYLQMKLQLVQFQQDVQQALLSKAQSLSDMRQQLGYESIPAEYDISTPLEYLPVEVTIEGLQTQALRNRPDLRAAVLGVASAKSQYELAKANGKQDITVSTNYSHVNGISAVTFSVSMPLPIFDRNQGNIAQTHFAISQAEELRKGANGQVLTDVRDAYEGFKSSERVVKIYVSGALADARKSREISEYAYRRGAIALLDFLNAERNYRTTELAYRQAVAAYLTSLEQLRQAVGTRSLP